MRAGGRWRGWRGLPKGHDCQKSPHNQTMRKHVHDIGNITACPPPVTPETPVQCGVPPPCRGGRRAAGLWGILKHTHVQAHLHPQSHTHPDAQHQWTEVPPHKDMRTVGGGRHVHARPQVLRPLKWVTTCQQTRPVVCGNPALESVMNMCVHTTPKHTRWGLEWRKPERLQ